jgi:uncharacterized damage-inducible protein DinB
VKPAVTLEELLAWNHESAAFWKAHLEANPALLELPCDIGGVANVKEFVAHIWGVELGWGQRIAGLSLLSGEGIKEAQLDTIYGLHEKAVRVFRTLLDDPALDWEGTLALDFKWLPPEARKVSRRKAAAHALFHSQRHWAQLATLVRAAGFPSGFKGDLLLSSAVV